MGIESDIAYLYDKVQELEKKVEDLQEVLKDLIDEVLPPSEETG